MGPVALTEDMWSHPRACGSRWPRPPADSPAGPDMLMNLASVAQLLICGRSDLLYFRSHEVNLHFKFKSAAEKVQM